MRGRIEVLCIVLLLAFAAAATALEVVGPTTQYIGKVAKGDKVLRTFWVRDVSRDISMEFLPSFAAGGG